MGLLLLPGGNVFKLVVEGPRCARGCRRPKVLVIPEEPRYFNKYSIVQKVYVAVPRRAVLPKTTRLIQDSQELINEAQRKFNHTRIKKGREIFRCKGERAPAIAERYKAQYCPQPRVNKPQPRRLIRLDFFFSCLVPHNATQYRSMARA